MNVLKSVISCVLISTLLGCDSDSEQVSLDSCSEVQYLGQVYTYGDITDELSAHGFGTVSASGFKSTDGDYIVHNACGYAVTYDESSGNNPMTTTAQFYEVGNLKNTNDIGSTISNSYGIGNEHRPHVESYLDGNFYDSHIYHLDRGELPNVITYGENRQIDNEQWLKTILDSGNNSTHVNHRDEPKPSWVSDSEERWFYEGAKYKDKVIATGICTYYDLSNSIIETGICSSLSDTEENLDQIYFDLHKA